MGINPRDYENILPARSSDSNLANVHSPGWNLRLALNQNCLRSLKLELVWEWNTSFKMILLPLIFIESHSFRFYVIFVGINHRVTSALGRCLQVLNKCQFWEIHTCRINFFFPKTFQNSMFQESLLNLMKFSSVWRHRQSGADRK